MTPAISLLTATAPRFRAGSAGRSLALVLLVTACAACNDEPSSSEGTKKTGDAAMGQGDTQPGDTQPGDTRPGDTQPGDIADAAAPDDAQPTDVDGAPDAASADGVQAADAVVLPKPATVPTDLPSGVSATQLSDLPFDAVGKSENLQVEMPPGAISFLAVVQGQHPGRFLLSKAVTALGVAWMKGECTELCLSCGNRVQATAAIGAALFPNASAALGQLKALTWHLGACGFVYKQQGNTFAKAPYSGAAVQTVVFVRTTGDGKVPATGRLRLRLFFTGAAGVTAATSTAHAPTLAMLARAGAILKTAGIALEVADRRDTAPGFQGVGLSNDLATSGESGLDGLFAQAAAAGGSAVLDVFVVGKLNKADAPGGAVAGVSGGVPGPAFYHGLPQTGVAVALGQFAPEQGELAGRALARQIGHFLGLWLVSTPDGKGAPDPLDDTPVCPASADTDADGLLSPAECQGKGADNAMFWTATDAQASFTAEQAEVMRAHPLVLSP